MHCVSRPRNLEPHHRSEINLTERRHFRDREKADQDAAKEKGRSQEEGRKKDRVLERTDHHRWTSGLGDVQGAARRPRQKAAGRGLSPVHFCLVYHFPLS